MPDIDRTSTSKSIFVGLMLLGLLLLTSGRLCAAAGGRIVDFTLFLKDDTVIRAGSRNMRLDIERTAFDIITYEKQDQAFQQSNRLSWPDITRDVYAIELINPNRSVYSKAKLLITRQDDTQTVIKYGSLHYTNGALLDNFHINEYNRVAGRWTEINIPVERVRKVVFGTTRLMINPQTGRLYPPDYRYDPRTGTPLIER